MTWTKYILIFAIAIILFRVVVADLYYVPTSSMEGAVHAKSYILVNKLSYGSKLPRSLREIPWVSFLAKKSGYNPSLWSDKRLPGLDKVKRYDIVLGEYESVKIVKRVIGLPGERLSVLNGQCYVNNRPLTEPNTVQLTQMISSQDVDLLKALKANSPHSWQYQGGKTFKVTGSCSYFQQLPTVSELKVEPVTKEMRSAVAESIFPASRSCDWDQNSYGSIHIPKAGEKIKLTSENWNIYCSTLERYENVSVDCKQIRPPYILDGEPADNYVFKRDYYFLMGDNRMHSVDSRFIGFIPQNLIFGRIDYSGQN